MSNNQQTISRTESTIISDSLTATKNHTNETTRARNLDAKLLPSTVIQVRNIFLNKLEVALLQMLAQADDFLFDMAENGYNNANLEAMRTLRLKKTDLTAEFRQQLIANFNLSYLQHLEPKDRDIKVKNDTVLELVKNSELEEKIAVDEMIKKALKLNAEGIEAICQRLNSILDHVTITSDNNPFSAEAICKAFKKATPLLEIELRPLLIIYKLFERNVLVGLESTYLQINQFFIDKGILVDLKIKHQSGTKNYSAASTQHVSNNINTPPIDDENTRNSHNNEIELLDMIRGLLTSSHSQGKNYPSQLLGNENPDNIDISLQPLKTEQLLSTLTNLQSTQLTMQALPHQAHSDADAANLNTINNNLITDLRQLLSRQSDIEQNELNQKSFSQLDNEMIDIVSMLFDFILDDRNLHSEIKALISRLQIPLLKVCLLDKTFFSNKQHPAKILLNEIAHLGVSWQPKSNDAESIFQYIQNIVNKINQNFTNDTSIFSQLLNEFRVFVGQIRNKASILEKRIKQAEEGKATKESARSMVNLELQKHCRAKRIPEAVRKILKSAWVHVMLLKRLKDPNDAWQQSTHVAKLLIWTVQPKSDKAELKKLTSLIPILIKNLRKGFSLISVSPIDEAHLLYQLEEEHRWVIDKSKLLIETSLKEEVIRLSPAPLARHENSPYQIEARAKLAEKTNSEDNTTSNLIEIQDIGFSNAETGQIEQDKPEIEVSTRSFEIIKNLSSGQWLDIEVNDKTRRCKLAAIIASGDKYVFVDRNGVKVAVYHTEKLALLLQQDKIKILDDNNLFDRALESVIFNLRSLKTTN